MAFDRDLVEQVIKHADIVKIIGSYLNVVKKGKDYVAICPFHDDTNPSMHISPEKQIFKCFVCGTSGNAITFVQKYLHVPFMEALRTVAELSSYSDPRLEDKSHKTVKVDERKETLLKCTHDLTVYYQYALSTAEGKDGLDYFEKRHLDAAMRAKYKLGYAFKDGQATCAYLQSKGNSLKTIEDVGIATIYNGHPADRNQGRVIFPICDEDGNVVGYSARRLSDNSDEAKYVNSPETYLFNKSSILYNYHIAKEKARIAGRIYVLEGFMDVFALARIGMDNAVAIMGTALTDEHIQMLRKLNVEVVMCLDGDEPGQTATLKIVRMLDEAGIKNRIVDNMGSTKDPDEILNQDGEEKLRFYLNNLLTRVDFALAYYQRTHPLNTVEEKKKLIKAFLPILREVRSQLELDSYIRKLAQITGFEYDSIKSIVMESKQKYDLEDIAKVLQDFHPERKVLKKLEVAERELLYQMLSNELAVAFYERKVVNFYDSVYRQVASFIIEVAKSNPNYELTDIITMIEMNDIENKDELINEVTALSFENNHPKKCSMELLNNLLESIQSEKEKIFEEDALKAALQGKSPAEQARLYDEYYKHKNKKKN